MSRPIRSVLLAVISILLFATALAYTLVFSSVTTSFEGRRYVHVPPLSSIESVADSLEADGILQNRTTFLTFSWLSGWGDQIKAGRYAVSSGASSRAILSTIRRGLQAPVRVAVPAGTRKERLARALARNMAFTTADVMDLFADERYAASLKTDTTQLFGYLLPDTYFFYWLTSPKEVVRKLKLTTDSLLARTRRNSANAPRLGDDEVLRMAAIVEWETGKVEEKSRIAGVYLNRLRNGWPLQADPTVQYAVMKREGEKRRLRFKDYDVRHPYNTYNFRGLPPGPVTNPSQTSIEAVLSPEKHRFYYFVAKGDGGHIFSRTLAEHRRNANAYYKLMRQRQRAAGTGS